MIKTLCLAATLLLPGLAYAGNPSANLPVQIVPAGAGIACDQGPNYSGSVPAPAAAAGFTHCALNADFTSNTTDGNGINYSDVHTWLANCGAPDRTANFYTVLEGTTGIAAPCTPVSGAQSYALITTDGGIQVMDMHTAISDWNQGASGGNAYSFFRMDWPKFHSGCSGGSVSSSLGCPAGGPNGKGLPETIYSEIRFRIPVMNVAAGRHMLPFDWWEDQCNGCFPTSTFVEIDFFESDASLGQNPNHMSPSLAAAFYADMTQYHTYGVLVTTDGNTYSECNYLDGVSTGACGFYYFLPHPLSLNMEYELQTSPGGCYISPPEFPSCMLSDMDLYVQYFQIWTCSGYWSAACMGPFITSATETTPRFAWLKKAWRVLEDAILPPAKADSSSPDPAFTPPFQGNWLCPDGHYSTHYCMPAELVNKEWWKVCVAGRDDCVHSDTAFIGWSDPMQHYHPMRGPGYCYTGQPYTCSPVVLADGMRR